MRGADLDGMASGLGTLAVAGLAAVQHAQAVHQIEDARRGAALARQTASEYAAEARQLEHDIALAELEQASLREELEDLEYEYAQECKRSELLAKLLVDVQAPGLSEEERARVAAEGLAALRKQTL